MTETKDEEYPPIYLDTLKAAELNKFIDYSSIEEEYEYQAQLAAINKWKRKKAEAKKRRQDRIDKILGRTMFFLSFVLIGTLVAWLM